MIVNVCRFCSYGLHGEAATQVPCLCDLKISMAYHCNQLLPGTAGVLHGEAIYEWRKPAPKIDTLEIIVFKYVYIYI